MSCIYAVIFLPYDINGTVAFYKAKITVFSYITVSRFQVKSFGFTWNLVEIFSFEVSRTHTFNNIVNIRWIDVCASRIEGFPAFRKPYHDIDNIIDNIIERVRPALEK